MQFSKGRGEKRKKKHNTEAQGIDFLSDEVNYQDSFLSEVIVWLVTPPVFQFSGIAVGSGIDGVIRFNVILHLDHSICYPYKAYLLWIKEQ